MKKTLLIGVIAIALAFTACQQPTDYSMSTKLNEIPGPSGLQVTAYEGVNVLTWNEVPNASGYKVIRRDTVTGENKELVANHTEFTWFDTVKWSNQLINERDYEYTVISLNGLAPNGHLVGTDTTVILQGESKAGVQAKIPATLPIDWLDSLEVKTSQFKLANGSDKLLVSFENRPNFNYEVTYAYGKEASQAIVRTFTGTGNTFGDQLTPYRAVNFPLIGGENTVSVRAWFYGGSDYYPDTGIKMVPATVTNMVPSLAQVSSFTAQQNTITKMVNFVWGDVSGATGYKIYRAAVNKTAGWANTGTGNITGGQNGIIVSSDWTLVTLANLEKYNDGQDRWRAREESPALDGNFYYAIIAEGPNNAKSSSPRFTTAEPSATTSPTLTITPDSTTPTQLILTWDAIVDTAVQYELSFAEAVHGTDPESQDATVANHYLVSEYKPVLTTLVVPAASYPQGKAVVLHSPTRGKNYIYKLVTKRNGVEATSTLQIANTRAFSQFVQFRLTQGSQQDLAHNSIKLNISDNGTFRGQDYTFELYRRQVTHTPTVYEKVTLTAAEAKYAALSADSLANSWTFTDTGLDVMKQYQYKLVAVGLKNSDSSDGQTGGVLDSTALKPAGYGLSFNVSTTYFSSAQTAVAHVTGSSDGVPGISARALIVTPSGGNSNLAGLQIRLRYTGPSGLKDTTVPVGVSTYMLQDGTTTLYVYYILIPTDAPVGSVQIFVGYPWEDDTVYTYKNTFSKL